MVWTISAALLAVVAVPAIVGLVLKALGLLHGASLHTWLLDVGGNVDGEGAIAGFFGAVAAALGIGNANADTGEGGVGGNGNDGGGGGGGGNGPSGSGSGGPDQPPWWQNWIPSSWTNVPVLGPISFDDTTGRVGASAGGTVGAPDLGIPSVGVSASADAGAAPGSDPHGPIVNLNYNAAVQTPWGNYGVSGTATAGINQQTQQNESGGMGFQGSLTGAAVKNFVNSNE